MFTNIFDRLPSFNLVELINGRVEKRQSKKKPNQKRKPSASDDTNIVILS